MTYVFSPVRLAKIYHRDYQLPDFLLNIYMRFYSLAFETNQRLLITLPPRHGKTTSIMFFIVTLLFTRPVNVIFVGHTHEFAIYVGRKIRDIILFFENYKIFPAMNKNQTATTNFSLTNGSSFFATGVGGSITGRGADFLILDDVTKNIEQANSLLHREKIWDWFLTTALSRLEPGGNVIIVQTRWHRDDIIGRCLAQGGWEYLFLPAIRNGEAIWPERYSLEDLEKKRNEIGTFWFETQYMGNPQVQQGALFENVFYYDELPTDGYTIQAGLDLAYSATQFSHWSAVVVCRRKNEYTYIEHVDWWQDEISASIQRLKAIQEKYRCTFRVEANGPQLAVFDVLRANGIRVKKVRSELLQLDKVGRALQVADRWNKGLVLLPSYPQPWKKKYVEVMMSFTGRNDILDDLVDATVYACDKEGINVFSL